MKVNVITNTKPNRQKGGEKNYEEEIGTSFKIERLYFSGISMEGI